MSDQRLEGALETAAQWRARVAELEAEVEMLRENAALETHLALAARAQGAEAKLAEAESRSNDWERQWNDTMEMLEKAEADRDRLAESVQAERAKQAPVIGSLHATSRELVTVKTQRDRLLDQALTDRGYRQELEAEVEKLREEMRAVEDGHRCQYRSRMETAEAELDRLAITLKAVQRIADDASLWGIESIARAALEGAE